MTASSGKEIEVAVSNYSLLHYKALPLEGLCSPLVDRWKHNNMPKPNRDMIDMLKRSIQKDGMRNPLTIEWFDPHWDKPNEGDPSWAVRIGNNRLIALLELGWRGAPALVIVPEGFEAPEGTYEKVAVNSALALFSADHPWWHSYILRDLYPTYVPRCA